MQAVAAYGEKIAVGVDIKDGKVAIKGWTEKSALTVDAFVSKMQDIGVKTMICTDISRDGLLQGANLPAYARLNEIENLDIVASGGISFEHEIEALRDMNMYAAIVGKALYTGKLDLARVLSIARGKEAAQ